MAFSKSTSRRGAAPESKAPPPRRRSHSVAAVSRKTSDEFSNSRDNPLFWEETQTASRNNKNQSYSSSISRNNNGGETSTTTACRVGQQARGRSVTRSEKNGGGVGRSLSRVRGTSLSSRPYRDDQSDKEQETVTSGITQSRHEMKKIGNGIQRTNSVRNRVDGRSHAMNGGGMTIRNQATVWSEDDSSCSMRILNLEDGISIGSVSEAEEKCIKAAYDELNAFRRNNVNTFTATNVAETPSDFVNLEAVELISEIRREYAVKLEESEERRRKLRADLAVEEHRGKELDRILTEILPNPKTSGVQRSRRGRRASNERKRMSKCLSEDAMAYFDECVSLSTFDSSDFSASEDPHYSSAGVTLPVGASSLVKGSPSTLCYYDEGSNYLHQKQIYSYQDSGVTASSSSAEPGSTQLYQFSFFTDKKFENGGAQEDIQSYIKNFKRGAKKDVDLESFPSYYDAGEYSTPGHIESLIIDRVLHNSRVESGGLLLCGGAILFLPFSPVI